MRQGRCRKFLMVAALTALWIPAVKAEEITYTAFNTPVVTPKIELLNVSNVDERDSSVQKARVLKIEDTDGTIKRVKVLDIDDGEGTVKKVKPASMLAELQSDSASCAANNVQVDSCTGNGCTSCGNGGCADGCCGHCCHWYTGVEAVFLGNNFDNGSVRTTISDLNVPTTTVYEGIGTNDAWGVAPRLWLGTEGECWGVRARYFGYNPIGECVDNPVAPPTDLQGSTSSYNLRLQTIDVEATRRFCWRRWDMVASVGYRHAEIDAANTLASYGFVGTDAVNAYAFAGQGVCGDGWTAALQGSAPFHCSCCWDVIWSGRISQVYGGSNAVAQTSATVIATSTASSTDFAYASTEDAELTIYEFQLGLRWTGDMTCGCRKICGYIQGGVEVQNWDTAYASQVFTTSVATVVDTQTTAFARSRGTDVDLYGFFFGAGFSF